MLFNPLPEFEALHHMRCCAWLLRDALNGRDAICEIEGAMLSDEQESAAGTRRGAGVMRVTVCAQ